MREGTEIAGSRHQDTGGGQEVQAPQGEDTKGDHLKFKVTLDLGRWYI